MAKKQVFKYTNYKEYPLEILQSNYSFCSCCGSSFQQWPDSYPPYGASYKGIVMLPGKQETEISTKETIYHVSTRNGDITFIVRDKL